MTRLELIAFNRALGFEANAQKFENMTDAQFESDQDFQIEKALQKGRYSANPARKAQHNAYHN